MLCFVIIDLFYIKISYVTKRSQMMEADPHGEEEEVTHNKDSVNVSTSIIRIFSP